MSKAIQKSFVTMKELSPKFYKEVQLMIRFPLSFIQEKMKGK
jgi:hypothetical protein